MRKAILRICEAGNLTEVNIRYKYMPDWWPTGQEEDELVANKAALLQGFFILARSFDLKISDIENETAILKPKPSFYHPEAKMHDDICLGIYHENDA